MKEHNLVIRATSTMSKLSDEDVAKRAVAFKKFVDSREWWMTVRDHDTVYTWMKQPSIWATMAARQLWIGVEWPVFPVMLQAMRAPG